MIGRFRLTNAALVLITIAALIMALAAGDQGYGWLFVVVHFVMASMIIAAFAMLGKAMMGRR